jgi:NADP-dependent 3-hydroxy acid dehydrogenase YdfG
MRNKSGSPRTVLVTGASSGMGEEVSVQYADAGWNVVATMRDPSNAGERLSSRSRIQVEALDVNDATRIAEVVNGAVERFDGIDALLNNAGFAQLGAVEEVSPEQVRSQLETNVVGVLRMIQAVLPSMRERHTGHILNVGSMGGHESLPTMAVYCMSKSAVQNLTEGLAKELRPLGIHVTLLEPAGYATNFVANAARPATPIGDYAPAYEEMADFASHARRGDLVRSMSAIVQITGSIEPPLHLALGGFGLEMARRHFREVLDEYSEWEDLTATTG